MLVDDVHIGKLELVSLTLWEQNLKIIKAKFSKATSQLSCELQHWFLDFEFMMAMRIVCPQYWVWHDVETNFKHDLATLKDNFVLSKTIGS